MNADVRGKVAIEESVICMVEASLYESRSGAVEGTTCSMTLESGRSVRIRPAFRANLESLDVAGQENGAMKLLAGGNGSFTFSDESNRTLFEGSWKAEKENVFVLVRNHIVADLSVEASFWGSGKEHFEACSIAGTVVLKQAGFDASGLGIFKLAGTGTIS